MQTRDKQDIRGRFLMKSETKTNKTNQWCNAIHRRQTHLVIHRPAAYFISFASQMIWQIIISPYVSELTTDFRIICKPHAKLLVKLIRAQGGCLGTKSR